MDINGEVLSKKIIQTFLWQS